MAGEKRQYYLYSEYAPYINWKTENVTWKAKATNTKVENWDYTTLKNFSTAKETTNKMERQTTE